MKLEFVLAGFAPDMGFRVFSFEGIAPDRTRTAFSVRTDMALIREYGIMVQELPLLCRELLERREAGVTDRAMTFTEAEMRVVADVRSAEHAAAQRKKALRRFPPRRPAPESACVIG